ncbi:PadR family transcriptional regulator [Dactylosporangium sp. CS-033363]|uniref:PadR family transcriptional regulator n=1 Tax=Dactylosporangium sp. CS-033363 TaxID=3239935 RepID=UPI003D8D0DB3
MRKPDRDMASLTVLALLLTGPRHTYEMALLIERTHKTFVTGLPRSLYHAVDKLLAAGHIQVADTTRDGARPERTVYELTDDGRLRLVEWVHLILSEPDTDSSLFGPALTYCGCLPPMEVTEALRYRRTELDRRAAETRRVLEATRDTVPRILMVEVEYEAARLEAERAFVDGLLADIKTGRLTWSTNPDDLADIDELLREDG